MAFMTLKLLKNVSRYTNRYFITNNVLNSNPSLNSTCFVPQIDHYRYLFWERSRKGRYETNEKISIFTHIKNGAKEIKGEIALWLKEMKELIETDLVLIARPAKSLHHLLKELGLSRCAINTFMEQAFKTALTEPYSIWLGRERSRMVNGETDVIWCFDKPEVVDKFIATSDSDHNEGYSKCNFEMSTGGRGLFYGHLNVKVPKDGKIKKAGYCAIRSKRVRKSFKRDTTFNWTIYNTLVLKVRGDGRSYLLNLSCEGYHDITWNDIYHYVLYTRGGPYWQVARIPFSKFILGSKGRIQDKQVKVRMDKVTHFGITCADKIEGPFQLEIEYVGLEFDPIHEEEFAYEMYKTDKYIVGV